MAISWMYRDDYRRAGFAVLPLRDPSGTKTAIAMTAPVLLLIVLTTLAPAFGVGSSVTVVGGLAAGLGFLAAAIAFWRRREHGAARKVLFASIVYLPAVLAAVLIDHLPGLG
jgi:protoheme IX farnesyltransferase